MRGFHDLTWLCFLSDLEHRVADQETAAFAGNGNPFDEEIGATRGPGKFHPKIAACCLPALTEHHRDLTAGSDAAGVARESPSSTPITASEIGKMAPRLTGARAMASNCPIICTPKNHSFDMYYILLS